MDLTQLYGNIKDFIYFISSPTIQEALLPVKIVFIGFTVFFAGVVYYFSTRSSWFKYNFAEDVSEFFSWQAYGFKQIADRWAKIKKRLDSGVESEYKLAIIEGDDFLAESLDSRGLEGNSFEEIVHSAGRNMLPNQDEIIWAHKVRNSVVYDPDFNISADEAKKVLLIFENAVKAVVI